MSLRPVLSCRAIACEIEVNRVVTRRLRHIVESALQLRHVYRYEGDTLPLGHCVQFTRSTPRAVAS